MAQPWVDFGTGLLAGGLSVSAGWGLFWLVIGTVGFMRGTCSHRVLFNSLAGSTIPLLMLAALAWLWGSSRMPGFAEHNERRRPRSPAAAQLRPSRVSRRSRAGGHSSSSSEYHALSRLSPSRTSMW